MSRARMVDPVQQVRDHVQRDIGVLSVREVARSVREQGRFIDRPFESGAATVDALPDLDPQYYGKFVVVRGSTGVADAAYVILRNSSDVLYWHNISAGSGAGWFFSDRANGNSGATNTTTAYTPLSTGSLIRTNFTIPPGTWDITGQGAMTLRHSANNGQCLARMVIGAQVGEDQPGQQPVLDTRFTVPVGAKAIGVAGGVVSVGIDFRRVTAGTATAGTFGYLIVAMRVA